METVDCDRIVALVLHAELMEIRAMTLVRGGEKYRNIYTLNMELADGCSMSMKIDRLLLYAVRGRKLSFVEPRFPRFTGVQFTRCAMMIITRCIDCTSTQNFRSAHYQAGTVAMSVGAYRSDRTKYTRNLPPRPVFVGQYAERFIPTTLAAIESQKALARSVDEVSNERRMDDDSGSDSRSPDRPETDVRNSGASVLLTNLDFLNDWISSDSAGARVETDNRSSQSGDVHDVSSPGSPDNGESPSPPAVISSRAEPATLPSVGSSAQQGRVAVPTDNQTDSDADSETDTGSDSDSDWEEFDAGFVDLLRPREQSQRPVSAPSNTTSDDTEPDIVVHGPEDPSTVTSAGRCVVCDSPNGLQYISDFGQVRGMHGVK